MSWHELELRVAAASLRRAPDEGPPGTPPVSNAVHDEATIPHATPQEAADLLARAMEAQGSVPAVVFRGDASPADDWRSAMDAPDLPDTPVES